MPLIRTEEVAPGVKIGLWRMSETAEEIVYKYPVLEPLYVSCSNMRSSFRIMEMLLERALLIEMTGNDNLKLNHTASGKPVIDGYNISISHTKGFEVLILSNEKAVGVDIEYMSDRVSRIADKFIRNDEQAPTTAHQLILWSVKETVFKLFSKLDLQYFEMKSRPFEIKERGSLLVEVARQKAVITANYELTDEYVLTYAISN